MKQGTEQYKTVTALNAIFYGHDGKIDQKCLNDSIIANIDNDEWLLKDIKANNRRKITSIVWEALVCIAIRHNKKATSAHVKAWLNSNGEDYTLLAPAILYYTHVREEHQGTKYGN